MGKNTTVEYATLMESLHGTGNAVMEGSKEVVSEDKKVGKGRAFSGFLVTEELKKDMENGTGADFIYFEKQKDGRYSVHPTLPEEGAVLVDGDRFETFEILKNNNWLTKGVASQFLDEKGNVDYKQGMLFLAEMRQRFEKDGLSLGNPIDFNKDYESISWLSKEFGIPDDQKKSFDKFCKATFGNGAVFDGNFYKIWNNWAEAGLAMEELLAEKHGIFSTLQKNHSKVKEISADKKHDVIKDNYNNYFKAIDELKEMANMDPVSEKKMYALTECSGSAQINMKYKKYSDYAKLVKEHGDDAVAVIRRNEEESAKIKKEDMQCEQDLENARKKNDPKMIAEAKKRFKAAREKKQTQEMIEDGVTFNIEEALLRPMKLQNQIIPNCEKKLLQNPAIQEKLDDYKAELKDCKDRVGNHLDADLKEKGDRKWNYHAVPILNKFQHNGKTFYMAIEAFAPEVGEIMVNPGMTDNVAMGVYESRSDLEKFYLIDSPYMDKDDVTTEFKAKKEKATENQAHVSEALWKQASERIEAETNARNRSLPENAGQIDAHTNDLMDIYNDLSNEMDRDLKLQTAYEIIERTTGINLINKGKYNIDGLNTLAANVYVNGAPFLDTLEDNINEKNAGKIVEKLADCIAENAQDKANTSSVTLLKNGQQTPFTHTREADKEKQTPRETEKLTFNQFAGLKSSPYRSRPSTKNSKTKTMNSSKKGNERT